MPPFSGHGDGTRCNVFGNCQRRADAALFVVDQDSLTVGQTTTERINRVHQNTLEQLALLLPALWMYAYFVNPLWGAGMGVVYLIGRIIYSSAYQKDPASRSLGFMLSFLPGAAMLAWVLVVAVMSYF